MRWRPPKTQKIKSFPALVKPKRGETIVFSWITFKSRAPSRQCQRQSDERSGDRENDEGEKDAVRFEAHGLWRIQGHGRRLEINVAQAGCSSGFSPGRVILSKWNQPTLAGEDFATLLLSF